MISRDPNETMQVLAAVAALGLLSACEPRGEGHDAMRGYGFFMRGVTGKEVMLDRTWYRECASDGAGGWIKSMRTMSGKELATTTVTYQNASTTPDCVHGAAMINVYVQDLALDKPVPITWTDAAGKPAAAPSGLEGVTQGNGATGIVTFATSTPLTKAMSDGLNAIKFAGATDWEPGVTKDMLPFFSAIGAAKGTIVVDDRTETGAIYDGISTDPKAYPTMMPNAAPHRGKLNGIKY